DREPDGRRAGDLSRSAAGAVGGLALRRRRDRAGADDRDTARRAARDRRGRRTPAAAPRLERLAEQPAELADDAAAERQHADDEDAALDDRQPRAELSQVVLERDDEERASDRPEDGDHATEQRHQSDPAR